jgi:hypothetical protein
MTGLAIDKYESTLIYNLLDTKYHYNQILDTFET